MRGLCTLFLIAAFPTQVWTILVVLNDFSWVAKRTNAWDAIGAGAYGLLFALVESVFVFLVAWLLSFLIPRAWKENKRLALLFVLIYMTALWVIFSQVTSIMGLTLPDSVILLLAKIVHRLRYLVLIAAAVITLTIVIPVYLVVRSERVVKILDGLIERLSLLTVLYLFLDILGIGIVIIRNIRGVV